MRNLWLLALVAASDPISAGELGYQTRADIRHGANDFTRMYNSCADSVERVSDEYSKIHGKDSIVSLEAQTPLSATFHGKKLHFSIVKDMGVESYKVALVPATKFLLHSTETLHKSISSFAFFSGYYILFPQVERSDPFKSYIGSFLDQKFAMISVPENAALDDGDYYLVPLEQFATLRRALGGDDSGWRYESRWKASSERGVAIRPSLVQTARGTIYSFKSNGELEITRRGGERESFVPAAFEAGFASHAAILARQGVEVAERDPIKLTEIALALNAAAISRYRDQNGIPKSIYGISAHLLKVAAENFTQPELRVRANAIYNAVQAGDKLSEALPPHLRWWAVEDPHFYRAPSDDKGGHSSRVVYPFLMIRSLPGIAYRSPTIRILSEDCIHLQGLHAQLGQFGLTLEKEGLVTGGHLAFEYHPTTRKLERIVFEANGLTSLDHQRGERLSLNDAEIQILSRELARSIPWSERSIVEIDVDHPDE